MSNAKRAKKATKAPAKPNKTEHSVARTRARAIDQSELVVRLADGEGVRQIARELGVAPSTVSELARKPEIRAQVEELMDLRGAIAARLRERHAAAVYEAAAAAAAGGWEPTEAQMALMAYFLRWDRGGGQGEGDRPRALPEGAQGLLPAGVFPAGGTVIVQVHPRNEQVIEAQGGEVA